MRPNSTRFTLLPKCSFCLFLLLAGGALVASATPAGAGGSGTMVLGAAAVTGERQQSVVRDGTSLESFMEEIRGALAGQWQILQNIRYHTLITKVRLVQLEDQLKKLSSQLSRSGQLVPREEEAEVCRGCGRHDGEVMEGHGSDHTETDDVDGDDDGMSALASTVQDLNAADDNIDTSHHDQQQQDVNKGSHVSHNITNISLSALPPSSGVLEQPSSINVSVNSHSGAPSEAVDDDDDSENSGVVTATEGETATLSCLSTHPSDATVTWVRVRDYAILTADRHTFSRDQRFRAEQRQVSRQKEGKQGQQWLLHISQVRLQDAGAYECQISTSPLTVHSYFLQVTEKVKVSGDEHNTSSKSSSISNSSRDPSNRSSRGDSKNTSFSSRNRITDKDNGQDISSSGSSSSILPSRSRSSCPSPYQRVEGGLCLLQVTNKKLSWTRAQQYCRSHEGQLAWEASDAAAEALRVFLQEQYGLVGNSWTRWPFWVGGVERGGDGNGVWHWVSGSVVDPSVWAPGQPRHYATRMIPQGACMLLDGYQEYRATALPCHHRRYFLCFHD